MILFLDYDGVLHPSAVFLKKGRPTLYREGELFMWAPFLIEALQPHPDVKIVLSTSWVRARGFTRARDALPEPLRKRVIGATWHSSMGRSERTGLKLPICGYDQTTRYEQIARYVQRAKVVDRLAIDDLHERRESWSETHEQHLIHCWPERGLGDAKTLALLKKRLENL